MRADLILDMTGAPGETHAVIDDHYPRQAYRLIDLAYDRDRLRLRPPETAVALAPNRPPEPDLNRAVRHEIVLEGGMMGGMARARLGGETLDARELFRRGKAWALNGVAAEHHGETPLLTLHRNQSCVLALVNDTAWEHPMHLHGHLFRVLTRNGRPTAHREWRDTVLLAPRERAEIAFVADNPGDWMLHCHVLEHQEGGMAALVRVA
jgi:FtsP/CotA-like multicopper oxidase with cupredoxin domain